MQTMRNDFCAFILTNGRPDHVTTYTLLRRSGYTGKIYIVIDDDDEAQDRYIERYGDEVLIFSKDEIAATFDEGDNFSDRRTITYARNACWQLAKQVGCKYFIQLDDDYNAFRYRLDGNRQYTNVIVKTLDRLFSLLVDYLTITPFLSIAISQGGDHVGGGTGTYLKAIKSKRKAMNTFVCATDRPFQFVGRMNEDVNTYTGLQRRGGAFLSFMWMMVNQLPTQNTAGGMSEFYRNIGTYVKSFYSVMYAPSCVKISMLGTANRRVHHRVYWNNTAACIIDEKWAKK